MLPCVAICEGLLCVNTQPGHIVEMSYRMSFVPKVFMGKNGGRVGQMWPIWLRL